VDDCRVIDMVITSRPFLYSRSGPDGPYTGRGQAFRSAHRDIHGQRFRLAHHDMEPRDLTCATVDKLSPNVEQLSDVTRLRHHLSRSKLTLNWSTWPMAIPSQDFPLSRLPGQVGFAGDWPLDGLVFVPRQPLPLDNNDGINLCYDCDPLFQPNQDPWTPLEVDIGERESRSGDFGISRLSQR
jgi:hypothetical protein